MTRPVTGTGRTPRLPFGLFSVGTTTRSVRTGEKRHRPAPHVPSTTAEFRSAEVWSCTSCGDMDGRLASLVTGMTTPANAKRNFMVETALADGKASPSSPQPG